MCKNIILDLLLYNFFCVGGGVPSYTCLVGLITSDGRKMYVPGRAALMNKIL